jgi:hypothetical protein
VETLSGTEGSNPAPSSGESPSEPFRRAFCIPSDESVRSRETIRSKTLDAAARCRGANVGTCLCRGARRIIGQDNRLSVYLELATHYRTAILPARPRKPRDKAKVS